MSYFLGIDLGTTVTAAATSTSTPTGGNARIAPLGPRAATLPSVVLVGDGEVLVGDQAERRAILTPHLVVRGLTRRLGAADPPDVEGKAQPIEGLLAALLRRVVDQIGHDEGGAPAGIALGHPAHWGDDRTELLRQAIEQAGLADVATVPAPEAVAVHHAASTPLAPGSVVAVYDLGGGTFDTAVLRRTEEGWEVAGHPEGLALGGQDLDEVVFGHVAAAVQPALDDVDPDDPPSAAAVAALRQACTQAKETLTHEAEASVRVALPTVQTEVRLTRAELEDLIRPPLETTVAALRRAMSSAEVEPGDVTAVLLAGGSSRIPLVTELLRAELGRTAVLEAQPKHAVALGAARVAAARGPVAVPTPAEAAGDADADGTGNGTEPAAGEAGVEEAAASDEPTRDMAAHEVAAHGDRPGAEDVTLVEATLVAPAAVLPDASLPEGPTKRFQAVPSPTAMATAASPTAAPPAPPPLPAGPAPGAARKPRKGRKGRKGRKPRGAGGTTKAAAGAAPTPPEARGAGDATKAAAATAPPPLSGAALPLSPPTPASPPSAPAPSSGAALPLSPPTPASSPPAAAAPWAGASAAPAPSPAPNAAHTAAGLPTAAPRPQRPIPPRPGGQRRRRRRRQRRSPLADPSQGTVGMVLGSAVAAVLLLVVMAVALRTDGSEDRRAPDDNAEAPAAIVPDPGGSDDGDGDADRSGFDRDRGRGRGGAREGTGVTGPSTSTSRPRSGPTTTALDRSAPTTAPESGDADETEDPTSTTEATTTTTPSTTTSTTSTTTPPTTTPPTVTVPPPARPPAR